MQVGDGQRLLQAIEERSVSHETPDFAIEVAVTDFARRVWGARGLTRLLRIP
jgi:hypothetical protein